MKIVAKMRCQLDGRVYDVGDNVEYDGPVTSRVAFNFRRADGSALIADGGDSAGEVVEVATKHDVSDDDRVATVLKSFTREQLSAKLDEMGITYSPKNRTDFMAKLFLRAQGEID